MSYFNLKNNKCKLSKISHKLLLVKEIKIFLKIDIFPVSIDNFLDFLANSVNLKFHLGEGRIRVTFQYGLMSIVRIRKD